MGNSLRDQLLKAGLVNTKQVKKAQHERRKTKSTATAAPDDAYRRAQAQKTERDRELNRKRQEEAERKAIAAEIKQLIETHRVDKAAGELPYNFLDGTRVKRIYVTKAHQEQLIRGTLCIAKLGGRHELIPHEVAEKIHARDERRVIMPSPNDNDTPAADDPYADYTVPDDLIW